MPAFENLRVNPFSSDRSKTVAFVSCKINTEMGALYLNNPSPSHLDAPAGGPILVSYTNLMCFLLPRPTVPQS